VFLTFFLNFVIVDILSVKSLMGPLLVTDSLLYELYGSNSFLFYQADAQVIHGCKVNAKFSYLKLRKCFLRKNALEHKLWNMQF
jgi:hypothetical protein